ncbi:hypothetical protein STRDD11_01197 [Streptococcus sp. DD11]|uniref:hypothetical protein n=1 Tax=Streptococcus sp. DD11 TaxID=1777879 RepID=UPI00079309EC|nr:hypothetical protein [Streptococcus sp. DD11]KXT83969.1 hypothetical protein STRDD11_01197 [Streptococcus sp. DD11]
MGFVNERIPEEYWDMLREKDLYNEYTYLDTWVSDKKNGIFLLMTRFPNRDDYSADYVLLWQNQIIKINIITVAGISYPKKDEKTGKLIKGLNAKVINHIFIPAVLQEKKEEVVKITKEAFANLDYRYDVEFRSIAEPEVR